MLTFRRKYLDRFLAGNMPLLKGTVLDIGGKKDLKRGNFRPLDIPSARFLYVNLDLSSNPDYCCDAASIPLPDESVDCFLMCEVLEHLQYPEMVIRESFRLLKPGGMGLISMPFLYQVHADPDDFQRWTADKLRLSLREAGFCSIEIQPMGGVFAVVHDLCYATLSRSMSQSKILRRVAFVALRAAAPLLGLLDRTHTGTRAWITTGWAVQVRKLPSPSDELA